MSGHMRKHHTSKSTSVASSRSDTEKGTPWREAFKSGIEELSEIGLALRGSRYKEEMTQKELAEKIGVKQAHISEMENGKRTIGKNIAHRLAEVFKVDYRLFL
jgi:ribosome-binding protein aMBF1 (putative translation factor)